MPSPCALPPSLCLSLDCHRKPSCRGLSGPSRAKQLACLQASIRLIQSGRPVMGATGDWIRL
eukprot:503201-Hanusia_phi.AAC.1